MVLLVPTDHKHWDHNITLFYTKKLRTTQFHQWVRKGIKYKHGQQAGNHMFSTYRQQEILNCLDKGTSWEVNATTQLLIKTFPANNGICCVATMPNESISHLHTPWLQLSFNIMLPPTPVSLQVCTHFRWVGHVACMGKSRDVYWVLVGKPDRKGPLGRPKCRGDDNIKMDL
jgi:hypothetical protein